MSPARALSSAGLLIAIAGALLAPAPARAAEPCPKLATCSTIRVPLDHSGVTPGTLSLAYARVSATGVATGTIVLLSGGPGEGGIPFTGDFLKALRHMRPSYDVVFLDQRGTGRSGAVDCPEFSRLTDVTACGLKLGSLRPHLTTTETARDVEDLRRALHAEKLTLLGFSYGTQVAAEYAGLYPERTAAMILDSPVAPGGGDPLDLSTYRSIPRVLNGVCTDSCRTTIGDPMVALRRAVKRLQRGPVRGPLVSPSGDVETVELTEQHLLRIVEDADFQPLLRATLPAAIASLARGDAAPMIHAGGYWSPGPESMPVVNLARLFATNCVEGPLPWAPDAPLAGRSAAMRAYIKGLGTPFAPFSTATAYSVSLGLGCERWPPTPRPAALATGPASDVPVLVISGVDDLRTPVESAREIAAQYPHATLIEVPATGHSVLRTELGDCARLAVEAFLTGRAATPCAPRPVPPDRYRPATLDALSPVAVRGRTGRTLAAVYLTLDAVTWDRDAGFSRWWTPAREVAVGGLRSGRARTTLHAIELHAIEVIRGVRVTGSVTDAGNGRLVVSGRAAGKLRLRRGRVTGTLGGRRIVSHVPASG